MSIIDVLVLSAENPEILDEFLKRMRKLKFDLYNGKMYNIIWNQSALLKREEFLRDKRLEDYRKIHPKKEIIINNQMNYYLRRKVGLVGRVGRPIKHHDVPAGISYVHSSELPILDFRTEFQSVVLV